MIGAITIAKKSVSIRFSNATLTVENGEYIVTEAKKEDIKNYNLSAILNALDGSSDLDITITSEDVVEPIDEG